MNFNDFLWFSTVISCIHVHGTAFGSQFYPSVAHFACLHKLSSLVNDFKDTQVSQWISLQWNKHVWGALWWTSLDFVHNNNCAPNEWTKERSKRKSWLFHCSRSRLNWRKFLLFFLMRITLFIRNSDEVDYWVRFLWSAK